MATYENAHVVLHNKTTYPRGSRIEMSVEHAAPLVEDGTLKLVESDQASSEPKPLESLTKNQLVDFAAATYDITLSKSFSKDEMIAVLNKYAADAVSDQV